MLPVAYPPVNFWLTVAYGPDNFRLAAECGRDPRLTVAYVVIKLAGIPPLSLGVCFALVPLGPAPCSSAVLLLSAWAAASGTLNQGFHKESFRTPRIQPASRPLRRDSSRQIVKATAAPYLGQDGWQCPPGTATHSIAGRSLSSLFRTGEGFRFPGWGELQRRRAK